MSFFVRHGCYTPLCLICAFLCFFILCGCYTLLYTKSVLNCPFLSVIVVKQPYFPLLCFCVLKKPLQRKICAFLSFFIPFSPLQLNPTLQSLLFFNTSTFKVRSVLCFCCPFLSFYSFTVNLPIWAFSSFYPLQSKVCVFFSFLCFLVNLT